MTPSSVRLPSPWTANSSTVPPPVSAYRNGVPPGDVVSIGPGSVVATTPVAPTRLGWPSGPTVYALSVLLPVFEP